MQGTEPAITTETTTKIAFRFSKTGPARYISHLDLVRNFQRAARRAGIKLAYSSGFNPHPKMTIASPLPVGAAGYRELAAMEFQGLADSSELVSKLNPCLPEGLRIHDSWIVPIGKGTFGTALCGTWRIALQANRQVNWEQCIGLLMSQKELKVPRYEGPEKEIRNLIVDLIVEEDRGQEATLQMILLQNEAGGARPQDVAYLLGLHLGDLKTVLLERIDLNMIESGNLALTSGEIKDGKEVTNNG